MTDYCTIMLALDEDSILFIAYNAHIFLDLGLAYEFLIRSACDTISLVFFNFIESYQRKSAIDFDPLVILGYHISWYFWLTSKPDFDSYSIFVDAVTNDL